MENDNIGNSEVLRCFKEMILDIKNSILIDDTHNLLSKFEEYSGTAFHISSFI